MIYWDTGCPIRKQNTEISWKELKKLTSHLQNKGIKTNCYLFEFGNKFHFDDSIKIDESSLYYEKSKKSNVAIFHELNDDCEFFSLMDSDLFFSEEQYDILESHINQLRLLTQKKYFTYNLNDIHENERKIIIDDETNDINFDRLKQMKESFSWRHSWGSGVLGGFFITPLKELRKIGGFNENFLTWGGEDDDAHVRIQSLCSWEPKMNFGPYHLWHPKNTNDKYYYIPVYSDEYFKINKVEKPK